MKAVGFCGGARAKGNTILITQMVLAELQKQGIEIELINLYNKTIKPCQACFRCADQAVCLQEDDDFAACFQKMKEAEIIILASPVYSADVSFRMKAFLDRAAVVVSCNQGLFKHKLGASIAAVRRAGGMTAVDTMNHFFLNKEMILVGSTYWNMVYGQHLGDIHQDVEGLANMRNLGQNLAWLAQKLYA